MPLAAAAVGIAYSAWQNKKAKKAAQNAGGVAQGANEAAQAQARDDLTPYLGLGQQGVSGLGALASGDYSGFLSSPDYLATQQSGLQTLDRSAAARGALASGGADADRIAFGANLGAQQLGSYRGFLTNLAQMGQGAAGTLANVGQATAGNTAQNAYQMAGAVNQAGANQAGLVGQGLGLLSSWYGNRTPDLTGATTSAYGTNTAAAPIGSLYNFGNNPAFGGRW